MFHVLILALGIFVAPVAVGQEVEFAQGPFSKMQMLLEKTIFNVDILAVEVQVDRNIQSQLKNAFLGNQYNEALEEKAAHILMSSENIKFQLNFLRGINFNRFISEIKKSIGCAAEAGVIGTQERDAAFLHLPQWFEAIQNRGIQDGDFLSYDISKDRMHTVLRLKDGKIAVDQTDRGAVPRLTTLGSYFAKCSDFREGLIRSLLEVK